MRGRQRAFLAIVSDDLEPDEIGRALGIAADHTAPRGSIRSDPAPVPKRHVWQLFSGKPETARLDDHVAALLDRLRPIRDALRALQKSRRIDAGVVVGRHFDPGPESEEVLAEREKRLSEGLTALRGQHPLLGFHLDAEQLAELAALGLGLGLDEYGDEYE